MSESTEFTQIIKRSIAYRAKYRVGKKTKRILPWLVVPHPKNRGGEPIKSIRTKELTGTIAEDGYDEVEANSNGVVVQEKPVVAGLPKSDTFQKAFAEKLYCDPEIAEREDGDGGLVAKFASLSHGHLNVTFRNISAGKRGCECIEEPAVAGVAKKRKISCSCKNKPILDEHGNYSMELLQAHDLDWHRDCTTGVEWEVLAAIMEDEEPGAAEVICISLNKKNETSMMTGHLEVMSTLARLCKPDPSSGSVPFQPVLDKLVGLYGSQVDHPDFHQAFRFVVSAGGADSMHIKDMQQFTQIFVNEKFRKMRMDVYAIIAPYPVKYVKIKNASLKWSWRQPTKRGWCQMPLCIAHRLDETSKFEWCEVMNDLEYALTVISDVASDVVAKSAVAEKDRDKALAKWTADVEILLMSALFAYKKCTDANEHTKQKNQVEQQCAVIIATQILELLKLGPNEWTRSILPALEAPQDSQILIIANKHIADVSFPARKPAVQRHDLTPAVIEMDDQGRVVSELATASPLRNMVSTEHIPWEKWVELEACPDEAEEKIGKCMLEITIRSMHGHIMRSTLPIALARQGKAVQALTTRDVEIGELVIPLFFRKPHSMVMENEPGVRHPRGVTCTVTWATSPSDDERDRGLEGIEVKMNVFIQPEFKLPKAKSLGLEWTKTEEVHPFWWIKRSCKEEDVKNMEMIYESATHIVSANHQTLKQKKAEVLPATDTYHVSYPCLVNTERIRAGKEIILNWNVTKPPKEQKDVPRKNAFDQIAQKDKRQRKARPQATGSTVVR